MIDALTLGYSHRFLDCVAERADCRAVAIEQTPSFDPKSSLAKVGEGRSIGKYRKDQIVFSQGESAGASPARKRGDHAQMKSRKKLGTLALSQPATAHN
jgi:hypothetical protein